MTDTTLAVGASGIVLDGPADPQGCTWGWTSDDARGSGAQIREVTGDNANRDGQYDVTQFLGAQTFPIKGWVKAPTHDLLHDAKNRLRALVVPVTYIDWTVTEPLFSGRFAARRTGDLLWTETGDADANSAPTRANFSFTLYCPDSYITSSIPTTFTLAFPIAGGVDWSDPGVDWSDPGVDWSSSDAAASATLINDGPPVPLLLTLAAPVTSATLTLQQGSSTQVQTLTNTDTPGADLLTTGQVLVVDNATGSVKLNGSSRNSWLTGDLLLVPHGTSTIYLTGIGTGPVTGSFSSVRP